MIRLVALGGTGDVYLVCALASAVASTYGSSIVVALERKYAPIAELFGQQYEIADDEINRAEGDENLKREYDNRVGDGMTFYAHPCFTRNQRLDELTILPHSPSQADMYRALLGLAQDAPLALPMLPNIAPKNNSAILIPDAVSWPNTQPQFWYSLERALRGAYWHVRINDESWSLGDLFAACALAELVVGPQCGVMSILAAGQFPCRKVFATPAIDDGPWFNIGRRRLRNTFPYAYVNKFDGNDYDVGEYCVTDINHAEIIRSILASPRGDLSDPRPVAAVEVSLPPGDFLDRLAVLTVKRQRGLAVDREYRRYSVARPVFSEEVDDAFNKLVAIHSATFDLLEVAVPTALAGNERHGDYRKAIRLNQARTQLRNEIDRLCRAAYSEVKGYYS